MNFNEPELSAALREGGFDRPVRAFATSAPETGDDVISFVRLFASPGTAVQRSLELGRILIASGATSGLGILSVACFDTEDGAEVIAELGEPLLDYHPPTRFDGIR